ncbi:ribonuclease H-like domain-containing protein [Tanacetum coccineum]
MLTRLVALLLVVLPPVIVFFLAITSCHGLLNANTLCLALVLKLNTVGSSMSLLKLHGYGIYCVSFKPLYSLLHWYIVTMLVSDNPAQHQCMKHIEIDIHFVQDKVATGLLYLDGVDEAVNYTIFLEAAKRLSIDPSKCLVIEASLPGMAAAKAVEIDVVVSRWIISSKAIPSLH